MVDTTLINAIGSVVISAATLVSAAYLLYSLWTQGKGKLRVRLLFGTVISDILVGFVALPPEAMYIAGKGLKTGTRGCDAQGFIFTTILFTQHMWTLCIAIATVLLLKYPLHPVTTAMEKYSWATWPIIWGISILHSGLWYAFVGFSSSGNICYYASAVTSKGLDGRDLVQFIPRALVFVVIVVLYSRLFSFLRRPDTIQLSTQFMSGSATEPSSNAVHHKVLKPLARLGRLGSFQAGAKRDSVAVDPLAPWEQMEFVNVGAHVWATQSFGAVPSGPQPNGILLSAGGGADPTSSLNARRHTHPASPTTAAAFENIKYQLTAQSPKTSQGRVPNPLSSTPELEGETDDADTKAATADTDSHSNESWSHPAGLDAHRPSEVSEIVTPHLSYLPSDPRSQNSSIVPVYAARSVAPMTSTEEEDDDDEYESADMQASGDSKRRPSGQTLKEFFQDAEASGPRGSAATALGPSARPKPQMSATAYFNRQASLLMLYFPLAYMFVFSVSLVRLVYDMVHHRSAPALTIISAWMVLSIGLIDALVFGVAEFIVRRRVRRKMPEHMGG